MPSCLSYRRVLGNVCATGRLFVFGGLIVTCGWAVETTSLRKVTFKFLANQPVEANIAAYAADLLALDGARITVTGYLLPMVYTQGRTRQFMLMRSQASCCYGQTPKANEFLFVTTESEDGVAAIQDVPMTFSGVFRIQPVKLGDVVVQCFRLEAARAL